jgi:hypothetical protein
MQKYLWGGAALIVVAAAGVYVASDYFLRHPQSVMVRAGGALSSVVVNSNPLSVMNRATTGTDAVRDEADAAPVKPVFSEDAEETIEPIQVESVASAPVPTEADGTEASEWLPGPEEGPSEPPKPMPYAEVDPSELGLMCPIEELIDLVRQAAAQCKQVLDDKAYVGRGCETEVLEVMPEEEAADDEAETPLPEQTAEPNYYHHYEGCTRMNGGCPYPHSVLPPQSPVEIPAVDPKPAKIKKIHKSVDKTSCNSLLRTSERRSYSMPILDTMEFRPSDAGNYPVTKTGPF